MAEWQRIAEIAVPVGVGLFILALVIGGAAAPPTGKGVAISNIIIE